MPAPHYEVEIHDADDDVVPPGAAGEICVRPSEPDVMFAASTTGMPEATLEAFRNLWFHTGDRGAHATPTGSSTSSTA